MDSLQHGGADFIDSTNLNETQPPINHPKDSPPSLPFHHPPRHTPSLTSPSQTPSHHPPLPTRQHLLRNPRLPHPHLSFPPTPGNPHVMSYSIQIINTPARGRRVAVASAVLWVVVLHGEGGQVADDVQEGGRKEGGGCVQAGKRGLVLRGGKMGEVPGVGHWGLASSTGVEAASPARGSRSEHGRMKMLRSCILMLRSRSCRWSCTDGCCKLFSMRIPRDLH